MENEIGKRYGFLTVIKKIDRREHETSVYLCKCDCGNFKEVNINKLHTGHTKSCGCLKNKIKDLTGKKFGRLTVISFDGRRNNKTYWKCKCDCGNDCIASTSCLTSGAVTSCGCKNEENKANIRTIDKGLVDGTRISAISKSRKINKNNTSGYIGVSYSKDKKKWVAQITFQRKNHLIGRFSTKREAIKARKEAEYIYFDKYRKS